MEPIINMRRIKVLATAALLLLCATEGMSQNNIFVNMALLDGIAVTPDNLLNYQVQSNMAKTTHALITGTIRYALQFTSSGTIKLADIKDYETIGENRFCYISMWVKRTSGNVSTSGVYLRGYKKTSTTTTSRTFTAFSVKTNSIDGWYKLEGKIDMELLAPYNELHLVMPSGYYVDDIRLYPDKGNMKSFAYDMTNMRLMAELDENNFATFYEYDQEGVLIRVKKESDRGILTVSENRKANAKQNK